jgi:hypothetical protein
MGSCLLDGMLSSLIGKFGGVVVKTVGVSVFIDIGVVISDHFNG